MTGSSQSYRRIVVGDTEVHDMKLRYLIAGLLLALELPVLLALAAGAFVAVILSAVAVWCSRAAQVDFEVFLRDCGSRLRVTLHERGPEFLRDRYRVRAAFYEREGEWIILAFVVAAVGMGALIAGLR